MWEDRSSLKITTHRTYTGVENTLIPFTIETNEFKDIALKVADYAPDLIVASGYEFQVIQMVKDSQNGLFTPPKRMRFLIFRPMANQLVRLILEKRD